MKNIKKRFWKWVKGLVDKYSPESYELPTEYPDVDIPAEERDKIIMKFMKTMGHACLLYFRVNKLKSHMECMVIDEIKNEEFIWSFRKNDGTHKAPSNSFKIIE